MENSPNTIERGASREIDPKTNVAIALHPLDAGLRAAMVGMERVRWRLTVCREPRVGHASRPEGWRRYLHLKAIPPAFPTGDPDRPLNVTDERSQDDEEDFDLKPETPTKQTRRTVELFYAPCEEIKAQVLQRDQVIGQISSALNRDPARDLSAISETSGLMQVLQNQVQRVETRCNQHDADNKRLLNKYDEKVAGVQDLKLDLKLLQA
ncbi:hypothetical protein FN846DRAFT_892577 [Sphaerosporella brunnea]|uniref:Uncharacterized protein n=1 Tax=Sphaerosporella brunnea TaxID=1250544 RepID=A0A5J5EQ44_9PEZI|nr:hypothetical protein FN846DRAFT_892577 [Sphaerosporella brunnea]